MTQFHEGQEVEIFEDVPIVHGMSATCRCWRKAKIAHPKPGTPVLDPGYYVAQFHDGTRAVFDAAHIRALDDHAIRMLIRDRQNNPYLPPLTEQAP